MALREKEASGKDMLLARTLRKTGLLSHEPRSLQEELAWSEAGKGGQTSLSRMLIFRDFLGIYIELSGKRLGV